MDYKKLIRSRQMRCRILQMLSFIPDAWMLRLQYYIKFHRKLNLENPTRFSEKLQWYKLYYRDKRMKQCVDKLAVRDYVREQGLEDILIPLVAHYDHAEDINWSSLPEQFVLKDTLGGGGNSVIICRAKSKANLEEYRKRAAEWLRAYHPHAKNPGREWVYDAGQNRLMVEEMLPSNPETGGLLDYKFFCFSGRCEYLYVIADRIPGAGGGFGIFTRDFEQLPVERADERPLTRQVERPDNYEEMRTIAEKLAKPFPEARIDLYDVDGKIYFGEITFFDGSGYMKFQPDTFDAQLGGVFVLPERNH